MNTYGLWHDDAETLKRIRPLTKVYGAAIVQVEVAKHAHERVRFRLLTARLLPDLLLENLRHRLEIVVVNVLVALWLFVFGNTETTLENHHKIVVVQRDRGADYFPELHEVIETHASIVSCTNSLVNYQLVLLQTSE